MMRRQTTYRRIAAELPSLGTLATTRSGEVGEVIAHEDGEAVLQFAGHMRGSYAPDEITWQVVGAQTEGKWQTEGAELHLADRDYPELGEILGKPAPAIVQEGNEWGRVASKLALNGPIGEDTNHDGIENCPKCGGVRTFTSGGQAVPGSKGQNMCYHCFHTWDKTASKTAADQYPATCAVCNTPVTGNDAEGWKDAAGQTGYPNGHLHMILWGPENNWGGDYGRPVAPRLDASKTADWSNPNNTDGIASVETYDPYGSFSATPGDCETCFGEGAFSDLNPDGKGFGEEHTCPDCGGTGKAS
jgi:hypothetical protein